MAPEVAGEREGAAVLPKQGYFFGAEVGLSSVGTRMSGVEGGIGGVACARYAVLIVGTHGAGCGGMSLGSHDPLLSEGEFSIECLYGFGVEVEDW